MPEEGQSEEEEFEVGDQQDDVPLRGVPLESRHPAEHRMPHAAGFGDADRRSATSETSTITLRPPEAAGSPSRSGTRTPSASEWVSRSGLASVPALG